MRAGKPTHLYALVQAHVLAALDHKLVLPVAEHSRAWCCAQQHAAVASAADARQVKLQHATA